MPGRLAVTIGTVGVTRDELGITEPLHHNIAVTGFIASVILDNHSLNGTAYYRAKKD